MQFGGDLLVHQARHDEAHDFAFAGGQRVVCAAQRGDRLLGRQALAVTAQGIGNGVEHVLVAKRLGEEIHRAGLHGLDRHGDVTMTGHEHDGHAHAAFLELFLEGKAALAAQPDVEDQAAGHVLLGEGEEVLRRFERLNAQADRT
ncbi:hypothetical protein FQZ97_1056530 [compost metagenome]